MMGDLLFIPSGFCWPHGDTEKHVRKNRVLIFVMLSWVIIGLSHNFFATFSAFSWSLDRQTNLLHILWQAEVLNRKKGTNSTVRAFVSTRLKLHIQYEVTNCSIFNLNHVHKIVPTNCCQQRNSLNECEPFRAFCYVLYLVLLHAKWTK